MVRSEPETGGDGPRPRIAEIDGLDIADRGEFLRVGLVERIRQVLHRAAHIISAAIDIELDIGIGKPIAALDQARAIVDRQELLVDEAALAAQGQRRRSDRDRIIGPQPQRQRRREGRRSEERRVGKECRL